MKLGMMMGVKLGIVRMGMKRRMRLRMRDDSWDEVGYMNEFGNGDSEDRDEEEDDVWGGNEEDEIGDRDEGWDEFGDVDGDEGKVGNDSEHDIGAGMTVGLETRLGMRMMMGMGLPA